MRNSAVDGGVCRVHTHAAQNKLFWGQYSLEELYSVGCAYIPVSDDGRPIFSVHIKYKYKILENACSMSPIYIHMHGNDGFYNAWYTLESSPHHWA